MAVAEKSSRAASSRGGGSVPDFPKFPPRFIDQPGAQEANADIQKWNDEMKRRWVQLEEDMKTRFKQTAGFSDAFHTLEAEIDEERTTRANADEALASYNLTVTARLDDVEASVDVLATAQALVNGFLDASWTVKVTAGNVVTGIQLFSSTGGGTTDVSYFAIQADRLQINTATGTRKTVFTTTSNDIRLGDVLVVDLAGQKMYIGAGNYGNADTAWYVDSAGKFSLKDQLTWDGATLTLAGTGGVGTVDWSTQVTGKPGFLTDGRIPAAINAAGLVVTGVKPGIVVSPGGVAGLYLGSDFLGYYNGAAWKTYMDNNGIFALIGSGSNSLTWDGTNLAIVGTISATSGTIGGFTLGTDFLHAGTFGTFFELKSGVGPYIRFGTVGFESSYMDRETFWLRRSNNTDFVIFTSGACVFDVPVNITAGGLNLSASGGVVFGIDTNLYRLSANLLRTDDSLSVGGSLTISGSFNPASIITGSVTASSGNFSSNVSVSGTLSAGTFSPSSISTPGSISGFSLNVTANITGGGITGSSLSLGSGGIGAGAINASSLTLSSSATFNSGFFAIGSCIIAAGSLSVSNVIRTGDGNAGAPAYSFQSNTASGLFYNAGNVTVGTNGAGRMVVRDGAVVLLVPLKLDNSRVSGSFSAGGHVSVQDATGATIQLLCI